MPSTEKPDSPRLSPLINRTHCAGTDTVSVKMVGKALQETTSTGGKVMTTVVTYKPSNRMVTLVANKQ